MSVLKSLFYNSCIYASPEPKPSCCAPNNRAFVNKGRKETLFCFSLVFFPQCVIQCIETVVQDT